MTNRQNKKHPLFIAIIVGIIIGVILGVTVLTPKINEHAASKAVVGERDLANPSNASQVLATLQKKDAINWRSAAPFPADKPNIVQQAELFSNKLRELSAEKMILPVQTTRGAIERERLFGALAIGSIDALFSTADIAIEQEPSLAIYGDLPFGPRPQTMISWFQNGAGEKFLVDILEKHNVRPVICGYLPAEPGGWYTKPLANEKDLENLRIRIEGLGAKVMTKAGAIVVPINTNEVLSAFDQDKLDAAVVSTPDVDAKSSLSTYAQHYYYPGWQSRGRPLLLLFNARAWSDLKQSQQKIIQTACALHTSQQFANSIDEQIQGLSELTQGDVSLEKTPSFILDILKKAWDDVLAEEIRKDETFLKIWTDLKKYQKDQSIWEQISSTR